MCQLWPPLCAAAFRVARARTRHCAACLSGGGKARKLSERARHVALFVVGPDPSEGHYTVGKPSFCGGRQWCDVPAAASVCASGFRVACARAQLCYLSLVRTRSTRSCHARVSCRAGFSRSAHIDKPLQRCEITLLRCILRCKTVVRRAICGLRHTAALCVARACAQLRCLSLRIWQSTQACRARAPCRAGCGRPGPAKRTLRRPEALLLRCETVVRCASCGLHRTAGFCVARARAPLRYQSLGRTRSKRSFHARAPSRAGFGRSTYVSQELHR